LLNFKAGKYKTDSNNPANFYGQMPFIHSNAW